MDFDGVFRFFRLLCFFFNSTDSSTPLEVLIFVDSLCPPKFFSLTAFRDASRYYRDLFFSIVPVEQSVKTFYCAITFWFTWLCHRGRHCSSGYLQADFYTFFCSVINGINDLRLSKCIVVRSCFHITVSSYWFLCLWCVSWDEFYLLHPNSTLIVFGWISLLCNQCKRWKSMLRRRISSWTKNKSEMFLMCLIYWITSLFR